MQKWYDQPFGPSERSRHNDAMDRLMAARWAPWLPREHSCEKGGPCACKGGGCGGASTRSTLTRSSNAEIRAQAARNNDINMQSQVLPQSQLSVPVGNEMTLHTYRFKSGDGNDGPDAPLAGALRNPWICPGSFCGQHVLPDGTIKICECGTGMACIASKCVPQIAVNFLSPKVIPNLVPWCQPKCASKPCGAEDGCGSTCQCPQGWYCDSGVCLPDENWQNACAELPIFKQQIIAIVEAQAKKILVLPQKVMENIAPKSELDFWPVPQDLFSKAASCGKTYDMLGAYYRWLVALALKEPESQQACNLAFLSLTDQPYGADWNNWFNCVTVGLLDPFSSVAAVMTGYVCPNLPAIALKVPPFGGPINSSLACVQKIVASNAYVPWPLEGNGDCDSLFSWFDGSYVNHPLFPLTEKCGLNFDFVPLKVKIDASPWDVTKVPKQQDLLSFGYVLHVLRHGLAWAILHDCQLGWADRFWEILPKWMQPQSKDICEWALTVMGVPTKMVAKYLAVKSQIDTCNLNANNGAKQPKCLLAFKN